MTGARTCPRGAMRCRCGERDARNLLRRELPGSGGGDRLPCGHGRVRSGRGLRWRQYRLPGEHTPERGRAVRRREPGHGHVRVRRPRVSGSADRGADRSRDPGTAEPEAGEHPVLITLPPEGDRRSHVGPAPGLRRVRRRCPRSATARPGRAASSSAQLAALCPTPRPSRRSPAARGAGRIRRR